MITRLNRRAIAHRYRARAASWRSRRARIGSWAWRCCRPSCCWSVYEKCCRSVYIRPHRCGWVDEAPGRPENWGMAVGPTGGGPTYGELLRAYREPRMKQRPLARAVGLSPTLLNRSEKGTRQPAGAEEVLAIAGALGLSADERDRLLAAAGYWPAVLQALGPGDLTVRAVAVVL